MNNRIKQIESLSEKINHLLTCDIHLHTENIANTKALGMNIKQTTITETTYQGNESFTETVSTSMFFSSAIRAYDHNDSTIIEYRGKTPKQMNDASSKTYTYDEYIRLYGKLPKKEYHVKTLPLEGDSLVNEVYTEEEKGKRIIGLFNEDLNQDTISSIKSNDKTILVKLDQKNAINHIAISIRNNGDFDSFPKFSQAEMEFLLDENDEIESYTSRLAYKIKWGFVTLDISQEAKTEIKKI